jgi:DNA mismatch endonuclease (patch repair protein)
VTEVSGHGWAGKQPGARAWKGRKGRSRQAIAAEQDHAAGGRDRRLVSLGDGRVARASVELKVLPRTRRIRAYLRWSDNGRSPTRYLGEVEHATRSANLAEGWRLAWAKGLLTEEFASAGSWATTPAVRSSMKGNKGRDTGPEMRLRTFLHQAGLRYRVSARPVATLRRTADVVFRSARIAVFVDGCYWHGCPEHYRPARINDEFWQAKIEGNCVRDAETDRLLVEAGWKVIRIWEHEDPAEASRQIISAVRSARDAETATKESPTRPGLT